MRLQNPVELGQRNTYTGDLCGAQPSGSNGAGTQAGACARSKPLGISDWWHRRITVCTCINGLLGNTTAAAYTHY